MDVVGEGRNATGSGTGKSAGSEPGGSDKESDNDEKVCVTANYCFHCTFFLTEYNFAYFVSLCAVPHLKVGIHK